MTTNSSKDSELQITKDGSHTLYSNRFEQHYHNPNGAVAESKHNFFEANGLYDALKQKKEITILEVGFGTGLNLLLLLDALADVKSRPAINYYSIEAYPIDACTAESFNFHEHVNHPKLAEKLSHIFSNLASGMNNFILGPNIEAHIFNGFFDNFSVNKLQADFIFHDAFSPDVNPELWTADTFKKIKSLSSPDAILTTYSAASKAKGAMAAAGWHLAKTRGALGKREMTLASLNPDKLAGFERVNEERLARRYEEGDF
jgi:tRNA U34 5-methylaminomethyl-2-thiouridine-forming methyltransferase MnmC